MFRKNRKSCGAAERCFTAHGASLTTVSALLLKRLHLRGHDLGGHTLTATHANSNGTASNGSDGASTVPCNIVQRHTGPQSVICSCRAQHLCMSHPNSQHSAGHQPHWASYTARWLRWWLAMTTKFNSNPRRQSTSGSKLLQ